MRREGLWLEGRVLHCNHLCGEGGGTVQTALGARPLDKKAVAHAFRRWAHGVASKWDFSRFLTRFYFSTLLGYALYLSKHMISRAFDQISPDFNRNFTGFHGILLKSGLKKCLTLSGTFTWGGP